ncbi:MAG: uracil-DNA glycosylase [Pseudomonadota bacterium]
MQDQNESSGRQERVLAMLNWYRAMGVVDAISETPVDWLTRGEVAPLGVPRRALESGRVVPANPPPSSGAMPAADRGSPSRKPPQLGQPAAARPPAAALPDDAMADAREVAGVATDLAALRVALEGFDGCALKATAKNTCFFRGAEQASVMVIGEAPGRDEDRSGMPFVGRAGQLLDKMLAAISLDEASAHITNVVYWRPPGNRTPTPHEVLVCRPFLERQIQLVKPRIIVTVGGPAAKAILNTEQGIMRTRGKWGGFDAGDGQEVRVMPTLHPAYLLRTPAAKRMAWRDLLAVRGALDEAGQ